MSDPKTRQFSLLSTIMLTTAVAFWCWLFRELPALELTVFSGAIFVAGLTGHLVYEYALRTRITVLATTLLLFNVLLVTPPLLFQSPSSLNESVGLLKEVVVQPAMLLQRTSWTSNNGAFALFVVAGTVLLTPAHSIRPCLPTAIMTAMGPGTWYSTGFLCLMYAG